MEGLPIHVDWVALDSSSEGFLDLMDTLWQESFPISKDLLYPIRNNSGLRRECMDCVMKYVMLTIHFICLLSFDLNTWCVSDE